MIILDVKIDFRKSFHFSKNCDILKYMNTLDLKSHEKCKNQYF